MIKNKNQIRRLLLNIKVLKRNQNKEEHEIRGKLMKNYLNNYKIIFNRFKKIKIMIIR
jgi:hypothetical protein